MKNNHDYCDELYYKHVDCSTDNRFVHTLTVIVDSLINLHCSVHCTIKCHFDVVKICIVANLLENLLRQYNLETDLDSMKVGILVGLVREIHSLLADNHCYLHQIGANNLVDVALVIGYEYNFVVYKN